MGGPYRVSNLEQRGDHWYDVKARLAPGVTIEQARTAMTALAARLAETYPDINEGRGITVFAHDDVRLHPFIDGALVGGSVVLIVVAVSILLLACSNLANLLLARGIARSSEIAVRAVLGAGRFRVARLLLLEALLLSTLGAAAGLGLAAWSATLLSTVSLPAGVGSFGGALAVGFDQRVVMFGGLVAIGTALLFGLLPAVRTAKSDVVATLRDEGRAQSAGRGISTLRRALVVAQVAISVVLVIGTNPAQGGVTVAEAPVVTEELLRRIEALPGVERAALTNRLPVQSGGSTSRVIDGYTPTVGTSAVELPFATVSRDYFETMGISLLDGRAFTDSDRADAPRVLVVNEAAALAYWDGEAVGGRIRQQSADSEWLQVVGVVADSKVADMTEPRTPMMYTSAEQYGVGAFSIVARTSGDAEALTPTLRRTLQDVRASLPVTRLMPLQTHIGNAMQVQRAAGANPADVLRSQ